MERQLFADVCNFMVDSSKGRIKIVSGEGMAEKLIGKFPCPMEIEIYLPSFIEVDGTKIGKSLQSYGFSIDHGDGWEATLLRFLHEVLEPIKAAGLEEVFHAVIKRFNEIGSMK